MTPDQAKRYAILGAAGATAVASLNSLTKGEWPSARIPLGGFVAGAMLAAMAEVWPAGAAGFSMVLLTTAVFVVGGDAWTGLSRTLANRPK